MRWIVERCLEKNPEDRYASTRDLARDLQSIRDHFSEISTSTEITAAPVNEKRKWTALWNAIGVVLILGLAATALHFYFASRKAERNPVSYHRLTYQRGTIHSAAFASDGKSRLHSIFQIQRLYKLSPIGFLPDSKHFLRSCLGKDGFSRVYSQNVDGGEPKQIGLEKLRLEFEFEFAKKVSPDGNFLIGYNADGKFFVYPLNGSAAKPVMGLEFGEIPIQWSDDSSSIFVYDRNQLPASVYKVHLPAGQRTLFKALTPPDRAGVTSIRSIRISPDEKSYAYSYSSTTGTLYTLDGLLPRQR